MYKIISIMVITLAVAFMALPADAKAKKPIHCKSPVKGVRALAYYNEGWRSIAYTTNKPRVYILWNKRTGVCSAVIKIR